MKYFFSLLSIYWAIHFSFAQPIEKGSASYYAQSFKGKKTASGQVYDPTKLTAAHKNLPLGTTIKVIRNDTQEFIIVRINDRIPPKSSSCIDLSYAAADSIHLIREGRADVTLEYISNTPPPPAVSTHIPTPPLPSFKDSTPLLMNVTFIPKTKGQYAILVGNFKSLPKLMKATQKLKEWGYPDVAIQYISKDKSENKEFRLFVAPISDKPAAEKAFQVLDKKIKFKIQLMELADIP